MRGRNHAADREVTKMYLTSFSLPIDIEMDLIRKQYRIDDIVENPHPCGVFSGFSGRYLYRVDFGRITIFYGGNGSGIIIMDQRIFLFK